MINADVEGSDAFATCTLAGGAEPVWAALLALNWGVDGDSG